MAVIAGLIAWLASATVLNLILRFAIPGYAAVEHEMNFTLGMMIARLAVPGALPSLLAGYACARIAPSRRYVVTGLIIALLAMFAPSHYYLWAKFPLWYHFTFLSSLVVLTWLGATMASIAGHKNPQQQIQ